MKKWLFKSSRIRGCNFCLPEISRSVVYEGGKTGPADNVHFVHLLVHRATPSYSSSVFVTKTKPLPYKGLIFRLKDRDSSATAIPYTETSEVLDWAVAWALTRHSAMTPSQRYRNNAALPLSHLSAHSPPRFDLLFLLTSPFSLLVLFNIFSFSGLPLLLGSNWSSYQCLLVSLSMKPKAAVQTWLKVRCRCSCGSSGPSGPRHQSPYYLHVT